jgi:broad specificity phosphatase PhoE
VILVRHAKSVVDATTPPHEWGLADGATVAAAELGRQLPTPATVLTSSEPKTVATAEALGLGRPEVSDAFREVTRPWYGEPDGLERAAATWFGGESVDGWETRADAVGRFEAGLGAREREGLVVVTHGTVMTAWLASIGALDDAFGFWRDLRMPDAWELGPTLMRCPTS